MMLCAALAVVPACNQVYGVEATGLLDAAPDADLRPDRDMDGVADVEDPCIAVAQDGAEDTDKDGSPNNADDCPFVPGATGDMDGDGIGDRCDPFATKAGDAITCTMRFLDPVLNASLWRPREGESGLAVASGYLVAFAQELPGLSSVVAQERIAPATGTIFLEVPFGSIVQGFGFRVWVSAGPVPSAADVACDFGANPTEVTAIVSGAASMLGQAKGPGFNFEPNLRARIVIQPGKAGPNLICGLLYGSNTAIATGHFDGELGTQGFAVIAGALSVNGVVVMHRDDQPDLL